MLVAQALVWVCSAILYRKLFEVADLNTVDKELEARQTCLVFVCVCASVSCSYKLAASFGKKSPGDRHSMLSKRVACHGRKWNR